jgi:hypothetical protein
MGKSVKYSPAKKADWRVKMEERVDMHHTTINRRRPTIQQICAGSKESKNGPKEREGKDR